MKSFFKEDEDKRFATKKIRVENGAQVKALRPGREWNPVSRSLSEALLPPPPPQGGGRGAEDAEDKNLDVQALRSEETLELCRQPKLPIGRRP